MHAEQLTDPLAYHGEGPVWFAREQRLHWVDMLAGDVLTLNLDGTVTRRHVGSVVAALRPRRTGGAVLGLERGFALEDSDGSVHALPELWFSPALRMNEGGCDPEGRFYCGSMAYDQSPGAAKLYRLDASLQVQTVLENVTISNGLEWSPDGAQAYYNDTATQQISVFDYDPDVGFGERRSFVDFPDGGQPDGLAVDAAGGVWTAIANAGVIHRYRPDGVLDEIIEVPATKVTACAFGGEHLDRLYITTSQEHIDTDAEPLSGALFYVDPGVTGQPVREFSG